MSEESNKALAYRFFDERWNKRNYDIIDELAPGEDAEDAKDWCRSIHAVFSEFALAMDDLIAEGDRVVVPWTTTGVLQTPCEGVGSPGERVEFSGVALLRVENDKIVDDYAYTEGFGSLLLGQTYQPA